MIVAAQKLKNSTCKYLSADADKAAKHIKHTLSYSVFDGRSNAVVRFEFGEQHHDL